jgi:hypothetical protein
VEDTAAQRLTRAAARAMASWRAQTSAIGSGAIALDTGCRGSAVGSGTGCRGGAAAVGTRTRRVRTAPLRCGARAITGAWQPRGDGTLTGGPGAGSGG